jgi:hypothetical protein
MALPKSIAPPTTAFQSDPRLVALYKIGLILAVGFDLSKSIAARAAERQAVGPITTPALHHHYNLPIHTLLYQYSVRYN